MKSKKLYTAFFLFFAATILFTVLVSIIDVKSIGPNASDIGFAALNKAVLNLTPFNNSWYIFSDLLAKLSIVLGFLVGVVGVIQFFYRKKILKIDHAIFTAVILYLLLGVMYVFFEVCIINYRPVILNEGLESSFPSSHTVLTCTVFATLPYTVEKIFKNRTIRRFSIPAACILIGMVVLGRVLSGVHWFTDIIGAILFSSSFSLIYYAVNISLDEKAEKKRRKNDRTWNYY